MRTVLGLVKLYLGIGVVLGFLLFGSVVMHSAMVVPPMSEVVSAAGQGAIKGTIRAVMWAPDLYRRVVAGDETILTWLLY
jgi:hypothetical protein